MSSESFISPAACNRTEVFAVHGADPEVLAYAMAKYSRSSLSLRESLAEISAQRAEQFLNTFYFQYGHRSIADLAHVAMAVERLSLLAAIELVDEQRWDGQERSTRYQNFLQSGWFLPDFGQGEGRDSASAQLYSETVTGLFAVYQRVTAAVLDVLSRQVERPATMKPEACERTLRARAFDVARYLLPLATNTSLGQIVSARTLETQIARLLSHPAAEVRDLGIKLREAATGPAWNANATAGGTSCPEVHAAPTLVKYAQPSDYLLRSRAELSQAAAELLAGLPIAGVPSVDLVEPGESLEVELAATLLYSAAHHPYRQIRDLLAGFTESRVAEIIELGLRHRGRYDEALRVFQAGAALRFDLLMDIGGFRDLHRHRRTTQILQSFTTLHGYETPAGDIPDSSAPEEAGILAAAGVLDLFQSAVGHAHQASERIAAGHAPEAAQSALYLLPLATRIRSLFKMDFAEAQYIIELRSAPAGHFSYRRIAWEMFLALKRQHPSLAHHIRATDFRQPIDLLQR
ncbi:MAG: FAD-dependent thymidylate synthase [Terracidiphilus sp.]